MFYFDISSKQFNQLTHRFFNIFGFTRNFERIVVLVFVLPFALGDFSIYLGSQTDLNPGSGSNDTVFQADISLYIDPRLLTGEIGFEGLAEANSERPTAAVEEAYFDEIVSQTALTTVPELLIDSVDFVRFFFKINVSTNQALAQKGYKKTQQALARSFYVRHSQDPVTLWMFPCEHAKFGCVYKNSFYGAVLEHQRACKIKSLEASIELSKVKKFPCDRPGCESSFDSKGRLTGHINEQHEWKPRSCQKEGCDSKVVFESKNEFKRHIEKNHSPYTRSRCQFPGCSSKVEYTAAMTYRHHLGTHGLKDRKEKDNYMPGKKPAFVPQKCQILGCVSTTIYMKPGILRDHLAKKHGYSEDEIENYLSSKIG